MTSIASQVDHRLDSGNIEVGRVSVLDDNGCAAVYGGRRSGGALDSE